MADFRINTELTGSLDNLAKTFAEADALGKAYAKNLDKTVSDAGAAAGKHGGKNLVDDLRNAVEGGAFDIPKLEQRIDQAFKKAGKKGGQDLLTEMRSAVGNDTSDLTSVLHARISKAFDLFGGGSGGLGDELEKGLVDRITQGGTQGGKKASKPMIAGLLNDIPAIGNAIASAVTDGGIEAEGAISKLFSSLPPQAQLAIGLGVAGAITASSSFIGGALTGALLLGVGAAGIGAAIAGQLHDPAVQREWGSLKQDLKSGFDDATAAFAPEIVAGMQDIDKEWGKIQPGLKKTWDDIAPVAREVFDGFAELADKTAPGFENAMETGAEVLGEFANQDLPRIGQSLSLFFNLLSSGGNGGASALHDLVTVFDDLLIATGAELMLLSKMYDGFNLLKDVAQHNVGGLTTDILGLSGASDKAGESSGILGTVLRQQKAELDGYAESAKNSTTVTADLDSRTAALTRSVSLDIDMLGSWSTMFDTINGKATTMQQSIDQFDIGIGKLSDSIDKNSRSLQGNSSGAATNREALIALIQQANQAAQAAYNMAVENGNSAGAAKAASDTYRDMTKRILDAATAAGLNKDQVKALIDQLGKIPKNVTTTVTTRFLTDGDRGASHTGPIAERNGGVVAAARGLITASGVAPRVKWAEPGVGREGYVPERGISQNRAYSLLREMGAWHNIPVGAPGGGGGGGGGVQTRVLAPVQINLGGTQVAAAMVEFMIPAAQLRKSRRGETGLS